MKSVGVRVLNLSGFVNDLTVGLQGARVRARPGPIFSWRLIMKYFQRSFSSLPVNHSRRVVVSDNRKYVHEVLVAQEKVSLGELTVPP